MTRKSKPAISIGHAFQKAKKTGLKSLTLRSERWEYDIAGAIAMMILARRGAIAYSSPEVQACISMVRKALNLSQAYREFDKR